MHSNISYGVKTFSEKPMIDLVIGTSRQIAWWEYFYIVPLCALLVAFIIFAVFFYTLFPIQLLQLVPYIMLGILMTR